MIEIPKDVWEAVDHRTERLSVPGGWIYRFWDWFKPYPPVSDDDRWQRSNVGSLFIPDTRKEG